MAHNLTSKEELHQIKESDSPHQILEHAKNRLNNIYDFDSDDPFKFGPQELKKQYQNTSQKTNAQSASPEKKRPEEITQQAHPMPSGDPCLDFYNGFFGASKNDSASEQKKIILIAQDVKNEIAAFSEEKKNVLLASIIKKNPDKISDKEKITLQLLKPHLSPVDYKRRDHNGFELSQDPATLSSLQDQESQYEQEINAQSALSKKQRSEETTQETLSKQYEQRAGESAMAATIRIARTPVR